MQEYPSQSETSGPGKWMWVMAVVCALGLLTLVFDKQLEKQINPNMEPESIRTASGTEVRLQQNRYGHYITGGYINGVAVQFFLDTGATSVSVPYHLADELGMRAGNRYRVSTANGSITVAESLIRELQIGEIQLLDVEASLNPNVKDNKILLGMSALKQLEFTQKGEWLILRQQ